MADHFPPDHAERLLHSLKRVDEVRRRGIRVVIEIENASYWVDVRQKSQTLASAWHSWDLSAAIDEALQKAGETK